MDVEGGMTLAFKLRVTVVTLGRAAGQALIRLLPPALHSPSPRVAHSFSKYMKFLLPMPQGLPGLQH
jgi:hypothetical protein